MVKKVVNYLIFWRVFFSKCRTKYSEHTGKPYNISILVNAKIQLFHRTNVLTKTGSPYNCWSFEKCIKNCLEISLRDFMQNVTWYFYISCTISILKFILHNNQIVHENHKNTSIFKILFVYKFPHKTSYG